MHHKMAANIPYYFGAANSYFGFYNLFDHIFDPTDFRRIYLLKGGPGTGKSSFMKKIAATFDNGDYVIERIYCSSDPKSLDGVIIARGDSRIAIIDSTAPHERDTRLPGAIDEIINLGELWDDRILSAKRDKIKSLNIEKKKCYSAAYSYLEIAGKCENFVDDAYLSHFDEFGAKDKAEALLSSFSPSQRGKSHTRFISSFGKGGHHSLDVFSGEKYERKMLLGDIFPCQVFLNLCRDILEAKGLHHIRFASPLNPKKTDAILLPDENILIIRGDEGDIDCNTFFSLPDSDKEKIKQAKAMRDDGLAAAERWFKVASEIHFELEEIYGMAMDFDKINPYIEKITMQIKDILENAI